MPEWSGVGKTLMVVGLALLGSGLLLLGLGKLVGANSWWGWLGRLPGDIVIKNDRVSFYFPLTTCLLLSLIMTLVAYLMSKGSS